MTEKARLGFRTLPGKHHAHRCSLQWLGMSTHRRGGPPLSWVTGSFPEPHLPLTAPFRVGCWREGAVLRLSLPWARSKLGLLSQLLSPPWWALMTPNCSFVSLGWLSALLPSEAMWGRGNRGQVYKCATLVSFLDKHMWWGAEHHPHSRRSKCQAQVSESGYEGEWNQFP